MSTLAQVAANQINAQSSCGPKTEAGKAASSRNHFKHGFAGAFTVLKNENVEEFSQLVSELTEEHQPSAITETLLIEKMAQAYWLSQRAVRLQNIPLEAETATDDDRRQLALYARYHAQHTRAFHKALNDLLKLRGEKRKAEIGFESQKHREAQQQAQLERQKARADREKANEERRQAAETRRQNRHESNLRLAEAKTWCREAQAALFETDATIAEVAAERAAKNKKAA